MKSPALIVYFTDDVNNYTMGERVEPDELEAASGATFTVSLSSGPWVGAPLVPTVEMSLRPAAQSHARLCAGITGRHMV